MRISDWSSDVCSSDLSLKHPRSSLSVTVSLDCRRLSSRGRLGPGERPRVRKTVLPEHRVHANEGPRRVSLDRLPVPAIFHTQHDPSGQSCDTHNQQCQEHDGFHVSLSLVLTSRPGPWTCCLRSYLRDRKSVV